MAHRLRPTKCIFHLDSFSPSLCVWSDWKGKQSKHPYYALNIAGALLKAREHELQSKTQRVTPSRGSPWASRKRNWELLYTVIGQLKMDELIGKIHVVNKRNQELIASVDALEDVVLHKYWIQYDVKGFFKLQELVEKKKASVVLGEFKPAPKFKTDIWDVFNDKLDWSAASWGDLKRLNALILSVVEKFELLDKSNKKVVAELAKYLHNLEEIQRCLSEAQTLTTSQHSRKEQIQPHVDKINSSIQIVVAEGVGLEMPEEADFRGSTILRAEHVTQLREWYGSGWKLLYQASRDGWKSTQFHAKCDNKGSTITVISHSGGAFLIGGYTSASWKSNNVHASDAQASLFTLVNPHAVVAKFGIDPSNVATAIYCHQSCGPSFGRGDVGVSNKANSTASSSCNFPQTYRDTVGRGRAVFDSGTYWIANEIEVYCVNKQ